MEASYGISFLVCVNKIIKLKVASSKKICIDSLLCNLPREEVIFVLAYITGCETSC